MAIPGYQHTALERFVKYVQVDTTADPNSTTFPSTEKQKDLSRILVEELLAMGVQDAAMDEYGYVYATVPATIDKDLPVIFFCSHVDTAPDCSGTDVRPIIHRNYQGQEIVLPDDPSVVIRPSEHPELLNQVGNDIVTASGLTLLGADDKAGVAAIMDAVNYLMQHPEIPHGKVKVLFTPDEEVGHGVDHIDLARLGADFGYTLDGGTVGSLEDETFSADAAVVTISGVATHPGYAKDKMEHALKIAAGIIARIPKDQTPETTEGKQGFLHPVALNGGLESATLQFIVRSFDDQGLKALEATLEQMVADTLKAFPNSSAKVEFKEQYRNMKVVLDQHPHVVQYAMDAIQRTGLTPRLGSIRGGTDGSRLSLMGLPCPNLFAGEHGIHSKQEWVSAQDMNYAAATIVHLVIRAAE
jgi:tripeptide aminopeptidase